VTADAPCSGQAVEVESYADMAIPLWTFGIPNDWGGLHGKRCPCLACADRRADIGRHLIFAWNVPDWRATPHPSTSSSERRGEE
jgi:hypothetical protein